MAVDPSIILQAGRGVRPIQSPQEAEGQALTLRRLRQQVEGADQAAQQQRAAAMQQSQDVSLFDRAMQLPDREQILQSLPGHLRGEAIKQFEAIDKARDSARKAKRESQQAENDYFGELALSVEPWLKNSPQEGLNAALMALQHAAEDYPEHAKAVADKLQSNPEILPVLLQQLKATSKYAPKEPTSHVLTPGAQLRGPDGALIAENPPKPAPAPKIGTFEDYVGRYAAERGKKPEALSPRDIEDARKRYQQADDKPPIIINPQTRDEIDDQAEQLLRGNLVPSMLSKRAGTFNSVLTRANKLSQERSGKPINLARLELEYRAAQRFVTSLNSTQFVRFRGLADSVVNTMDEVRRLSEELKQGNVQLWNRATRKTVLQLFSDTPQAATAAQYASAVNTLKEEFANLANGGYAPTEAAWKLANEQINGDYGPKALDASLTEAQRLINYRMAGFANQAPVLPPEPGATPPPAAAPNGAASVPDLQGLQPGHGRTFSAGPFKGQTWTIGPDGKPVKVKG